MTVSAKIAAFNKVAAGQTPISTTMGVKGRATKGQSVSTKTGLENKPTTMQQTNTYSLPKFNEIKEPPKAAETLDNNISPLNSEVKEEVKPQENNSKHQSVVNQAKTVHKNSYRMSQTIEPKVEDKKVSTDSTQDVKKDIENVKLNQISNEILLTEQTFSNSIGLAKNQLNQILNLYNDDRNKYLTNNQKMYLAIYAKSLAELDNATKIFNNLLNKLTSDSSNTSKLETILDAYNSPEFKQYAAAMARCVGSFDIVNSMYTELKASDSRVRKIEDDYKKQNQLTFGSTHITYIQRMPRHVLLINEVLKNISNGDPLKEKSNKALEVIQSSAKNINENQNKGISALTIKEMKNSISIIKADLIKKGGMPKKDFIKKYNDLVSSLKSPNSKHILNTELDNLKKEIEELKIIYKNTEKAAKFYKKL